MGIIKGKKTNTGADVYDSMQDVHLSFDQFRYMEAVNGDIVLRGRNGGRDHLFPLEKAAAKYVNWMDLVYSYFRNGINGWDTAFEIGKEFRARICEAVEQRKKEGRDVPESALRIVAGDSKPAI